jgi:hypothetical protein
MKVNCWTFPDRHTSDLTEDLPRSETHGIGQKYSDFLNSPVPQMGCLRVVMIRRARTELISTNRGPMITHSGLLWCSGSGLIQVYPDPLSTSVCMSFFL